MREVMHYAIMMADWPQNQKKSEIEVIQQVQYWWQTVRSLEQAKIEKRVLLATAAKAYDDEHYFPESASQPKGAITHEMWIRRLHQYPGDKLDLFLDFVFAEEVPAGELLKELFPNAKVSRKEQLKKLLAFTGKGHAKRFLERVASFLTSGCDETKRQLLLSAIAEGNIHKACEWVAPYCGERFLDQQPMVELILVAKQDYGRCFPDDPTRELSVPALLCRPLIHFRQMQISGIKAKSARAKATNSAAKKSLADQPDPKGHQQ